MGMRHERRLLLRFYPTDWCKYQQLLFSDDGCESSEQPDAHTRGCKKDVFRRGAYCA